jgi:hypothetical protein
MRLVSSPVGIVLAYRGLNGPAGSVQVTLVNRTLAVTITLVPGTVLRSTEKCQEATRTSQLIFITKFRRPRHARVHRR